MRTSVLIGCALLATSVNAFANQMEAFGTMNDFTAPIDYDATTLVGPTAGLIVYDSYGNALKGKAANSAAWQTLSPTSAISQIRTVTTTSTLAATDNLCLANATGAAFTVNIPSAVSNSGKIFQIKKTDSSLNAITIDLNGSEAIDGSSTTTINTQYESITIVSDGANWVLSNRSYPQSWTSYTPTGGWAANVTYAGKWRRVGDSMEIAASITASDGTSGSLSVAVPTGYTIDTSKLPVSARNMALGITQFTDSSAGQPYSGVVIYGTTPEVNVISTTAATANVVSGNSPFTWANLDEIGMTFKVPISGWK